MTRDRESGQAALLLLGLLAALLAGTLVLFGFGQALGARGKHQRAADLPDGGFAPSRITVGVRGQTEPPTGAGDRSGQVEIKARATAELMPSEDAGFGTARGGYEGPLAYRQGKPSRYLSSAL